MPWLDNASGSWESFKGSTPDYMGIYDSTYTETSDPTHVLAFPHLAYCMIWNEFYRDQDLQNKIEVSLDSQNRVTTSSGSETALRPLPVAWPKDVYNTSRPWTQRGEEVFVPTYQTSGSNSWKQNLYSIVSSITFTLSPTENPAQGKMNVTANNFDSSLNGTYDVGGSGFEINWVSSQYSSFISQIIPKIKTLINKLTWSQLNLEQGKTVNVGSGNLPIVKVSSVNQEQSGINQPVMETILNLSVVGSQVPDSNLRFSVRLSGSFIVNHTPALQGGSMSIRDLRLSSALQRFQENRAKWGNRYIEYLQFLGIRSSDARLQLPEYLGGGSQMINISQVLQTAPGDTGAVGTMAGHGLTAMRTNKVTRFFEEHGVILSLMSVIPTSVYSQGTKRYFFKRNWTDFFHRDLQDIGMQEVYRGEIYSTGIDAEDRSVFGYQDRYQEYRRSSSYVSGDFHDTLDFWHLARKFDGAPGLNASFIECNPSKRIFADTQSHPLWIMCNNHIVAKRMLSKRASTRLK